MARVAGLALGFIAVLAAMPALASGREGEQYAAVFVYMIAAGLVGFAGSIIAGVVVGAVKARRAGESGLKGGARGVLTGLKYFVILGVVTFVLVNVLGFLWITYALVATPVADHP